MLHQELSQDLEEVGKWSRANNMCTKTKTMLAVSKRLRKRFDQLSLANKEIELVNSHKLVGLKIAHDLTYDEHIDSAYYVTSALTDRQRSVYYYYQTVIN